MSTTGHRLADTFLAGDVPSAGKLLAADASFHSPVRDYVGADRIREVWQAVAGVVQSVTQTSVYERDNETVTFFVGTIRDQAVDGVLRTLVDANDEASDITLMIRPWAALKVGARLSRTSGCAHAGAPSP